MADLFNIDSSKELTIGENRYVVADLPDNVQELVQLYDKWREDELHQILELRKVKGALTNLSREIVTAITTLENADKVEDDVVSDEVVEDIVDDTGSVDGE